MVSPISASSAGSGSGTTASIARLMQQAEHITEQMAALREDGITEQEAEQLKLLTNLLNLIQGQIMALQAAEAQRQARQLQQAELARQAEQARADTQADTAGGVDLYA